MIDGIPYLPGLVPLLVYDENPVHFLLMCCTDIEWVHKTQQVYDPEIEIVHDIHFLRLNVND